MRPHGDQSKTAHRPLDGPGAGGFPKLQPDRTRSADEPTATSRRSRPRGRHRRGPCSSTSPTPFRAKLKQLGYSNPEVSATCPASGRRPTGEAITQGPGQTSDDASPNLNHYGRTRRSSTPPRRIDTVPSQKHRPFSRWFPAGRLRRGGSKIDLRITRDATDPPRVLFPAS